MSLTASEAASLAHRTPRSLRALAARGQIPGARKSGGTWVFPLSSIYALPDPRKRTINDQKAEDA